MPKLKVRLVYRRSQKSIGSVTMRVSQLTELINKFGTGSLDLQITPIASFRFPMIEKMWVPRGALPKYHAKWPIRQAKIVFIVAEGRMTAATFAGSA